jgi:aldose 1-epimerase
MTATQTLFGTMPDGQPVHRFTLTNAAGASFSIINLGATVQSLYVPDRTGKLADVVLGYDHLDGYLENNPYLGAIVGRYGNRIHNGQFSLNGKTYQLAQNDGEQHLHGGPMGFDKKLWQLDEIAVADGVGVLATLDSPDGEENYPGHIRLDIRISLSNDNELRFEYSGTTDRPTILNPTHHSYFNLSGFPDTSIESHTLQIHAAGYTPVDAALIPSGRIERVDGSPMDFLQPVPIEANIGQAHEQLIYGGGFDHNFVLAEYQPGKVREIAVLTDAISGRIMTVHSDQPGVQFYSGNNLDGSITGKEGFVYGRRCGLCLEAQHFPDSPNHADFPSTVVTPGSPYRQFTSYRFSTSG